jgi:hypothetical protein
MSLPGHLKAARTAGVKIVVSIEAVPSPRAVRVFTSHIAHHHDVPTA